VIIIEVYQYVVYCIYFSILDQTFMTSYYLYFIILTSVLLVFTQLADIKLVTKVMK